MSTTAVLERTAELIGAPELLVDRSRKGKAVRDDVRPAIRSLEPAPELAGRGGPAGTTHWIRTELATTGRGLRPAELIALIGPDLSLVRPVRRAQWIEDDRGRFEPLTVSGELPPADTVDREVLAVTNPRSSDGRASQHRVQPDAGAGAQQP